MPLVNQRKELFVGWSERGAKRLVRKQNKIRQSPTPVPSCHRQYIVSNASQYNIQPNLEFCPHCPSLHTCGFTTDSIQKVWKRNPAPWEWEGIAPEHARALAVCGMPLQNAAGHHSQTKIPHPLMGPKEDPYPFEPWENLMVVAARRLPVCP